MTSSMTAGADRLAHRRDRRLSVDHGPGDRLRGEVPDVIGTEPTARELEVIAAVCRLGAQKEAAHELGITIRTVKSHLWVLSRKVGADGTLTGTLIALGWLHVPTDHELVEQARGGIIADLRRRLLALRAEVDAEVDRLLAAVGWLRVPEARA